LPRGARNSLRLLTLLDWPDRAPRLLSQFSKDPVLVLAPHFDDEVIGPGGTLRQHVLAGANVTVAYMTDGRRGEPETYSSGFAPAEVARREQALVERRKAESRTATAILGIADLFFFDGPDGALLETTEMVARLVGLLNRVRPAFVYLPAVSDNHPDHWATNRIYRAALAQASDELRNAILIRGYEVWTPLPANIMVDIGDVFEIKRQAIDAFPSQTRYVDYTRIAAGLASYRSMMHLHGRGYAEAFFETTAAEYERLFEAITVRKRAA
jgi:LmbE family N-acetylglucosaminyl deacetylase